PSVCKSDPCIKDVIINGYNGFQYDSFESFENHINYIIDNREIYGSLSENARITAEKYTTGLFADKVESLYKNVIYEYSNYSKINKEA
ncbi:MAG: glycosyltransferase family 4 protein, partial [Sedimentibacter sp.]